MWPVGPMGFLFPFVMEFDHVNNEVEIQTNLLKLITACFSSTELIILAIWTMGLSLTNFNYKVLE